MANGNRNLHDNPSEAASRSELDVIWSRFAGIVFGVIAMRLVFSFPGFEARLDSLAPHADADHEKAA